MDNNNNNGRGIFYGVIGVATLVVAIIGATFAYFTAEITRNNAIANVKSTKLSLDIINEDSNFRTDMIPVDATGNGTVFSTFPGLDDTEDLKGSGCRDLVGNSICSVYQFTVEIPSETVAQTVVGSLKVDLNGFTNLSYALFKGSDTQILASDGKYNVDAKETVTTVISQGGTKQVDSDPGTLIHKGVFGAAESEIKWPNTLEKLEAEETTTYTVVVWLEEAGEANDAEQDQSFTASITFTSDTGEGGVTGVLTTSS